MTREFLFQSFKSRSHDDDVNILVVLVITKKGGNARETSRADKKKGTRECACDAVTTTMQR